MASCRFLNRSLRNKASPVVLLVVLTGIFIVNSSLASNFSGTSLDLNCDSILVLLFLELLVLGGGRILRLLVDFGRLVFFSGAREDETFLRLFFLSFFFGRLGGGVGMNEPEPDNISSCSLVNSKRRSERDMTELVISGRMVVLLNDCFGRLTLVGLPDPFDRPEGVGAKFIVSAFSSDTSDSTDESGLVIDITSN